MSESSGSGRTGSRGACVRVRLEGAEEREVVVDETLTIGRGPENDLTIDHASVSRRHAEIRRGAAGAHRVVDLDSLNGTFMNGQRLTCERELYHADELWVGEATVLFLDPDGPGRSDVAEDAWRGLRGDIDWDAEGVDSVRVVALMCDIRNCASLAQKLPGSEFQDFVAEWWEQARALLGRHGALRDGIERDTLLVYWRIEHEDAPRAEVNIALRAAGELWQLGREYAQRFSERFDLGSLEITQGVHLGDVSVAKLAEQDLCGIAGPTIAVADRLGSLDRDDAFAVVTSWQVAQWASPEFQFHNLGEVSLEGAETPPLSALALDMRRDVAPG